MGTSSPTSQSLRLSSTLSECDRLYKFLERFLFEHRISDETVYDVKLIAEEVISNIINHGYKKVPDQVIEIVISTNNNEIKICFMDDAAECNPLDFFISTSDEKDLCNGSMGLRIIMSITDTQYYERIDNRNVLTVTKHYNN